MEITDTAGNVYCIPDFCSYCNMDTVGNHEYNCPCYNQIFIHRYKKIVEEDNE